MPLAGATKENLWQALSSDDQSGAIVRLLFVCVPNTLLASHHGRKWRCSFAS